MLFRLHAAVVLIVASSIVVASEPSQRTKSPTIELEFVLIPSGNFRMGTRWTPEQVRRFTGNKTPARDGYPVHEVELEALYMSTTEVTVRQWRLFKSDAKYRTTATRVGHTYKWYRPEFEQTAEHPVTYISYEDAVAFAKWLSAKEHDVVYRLPTEAEWEYACRAGGHDELPWGADLKAAGEYANLAGDADGYAHTSPVASLKPNAWGLYDMIGNVWEFCSDWVADDYYTVSPTRNPTGPDHGELRAYRGGSWEDTRNARPGVRNRQPPTAFYRNSGFRLVRELPESRGAWVARVTRQWQQRTGQELTAVGRVGENVVIDGVRWKVTGAKVLGDRLQGRGLREPKTTRGKFVRVDFQIENLGKQPVTFLSRELFDSKGRRYDTLSDAFAYFDDNTVFLLERINPNIPTQFVQVYEVPKDARGFGVGISNLRLMHRQEGLIDLGF
jgi:formylglycine-generating enzyme required for sulfatase activity